MSERSWIPITASISPEITKFPKLATSILWVGLSISTTYCSKWIVHFKSKFGLDSEPNIKHSILSVQVCKTLHCIITTIIINYNYNIELTIEKLCHETNSLKSDFVPDCQSHSMMINFTCQKLVIASDFPKYLLTNEKRCTCNPHLVSECTFLRWQ